MKPWADMSQAERNQHTADVLERQRAKREMIVAFKAEHGCAVCGESDPVVLDLHHRDPSEKRTSLKRQSATRGGLWMVRLGWGAIREELEKCDVLCANCHRRHHHAREARTLEARAKPQSAQQALWTD